MNVNLLPVDFDAIFGCKEVPQPPICKLALHYSLTAAADRALADWHEGKGEHQMAEFFRAQAALHADMATQAEVEPA